MTETRQLNVLFVCTGNICRSPLAAQLLDREIQRLTGSAAGDSMVAVSSRGTRAVVGAPMDALAAKQSRSRGGDPSEHVGAQLLAADLEAADLIVTMTLEQRASTARLLPSASKRAVTLLELSRLLEHEASSRRIKRNSSGTLRERLQELLGRRSSMQPLRHESDLNIVDPFTRSSGVHAKVAREIQSAILPLAEWLAETAGASAEHVVAEPSAAEPDVAEPDVAEPVVAEPDVAEPDVAELVVVEPDGVAIPADPPLTRRQARELRELSGAS